MFWILTIILGVHFAIKYGIMVIIP